MAHRKMYAGHTGTRVGGLTENTRHSTMETTHNTKRQARWRWRQQRTNDNLKGKPTTILTLWGAKVVCVQSFRPRWWRDTDGERHHSNIFETLKKETFHSNWHWTLVTQNTTPNDVIFFYSNNSAPSSSIFFCLPQQLGCDFLAFKPHVLKINLDANESEGN